MQAGPGAVNDQQPAPGRGLLVSCYLADQPPVMSLEDSGTTCHSPPTPLPVVTYGLAPAQHMCRCSIRCQQVRQRRLSAWEVDLMAPSGGADLGDMSLVG